MATGSDLKYYHDGDVVSFRYRNLTCGKDRSLASAVYPGEANISTYPWMGLLYFPIYNNLYTTGVVLISRQMVLGSAFEIDKMPKREFRSRVRVVLGHKCEVNPIRVRDYAFHPDFLRNTVSALILVQLELDHVRQELRPICPPPDHFIHPTIYAMALTDDCVKLKVKLYRMQYVPIDRCQDFYRRNSLNEESLWPKHTTCAKAITKEKCVWKSGTALVMKHDGRWRLLGFSIFGPGCNAPSRFLDYGKYHAWVRRSVATVGLPAVTRVADNHLVLRRSSSNLQRYGDCDIEEMEELIYSETVQIVASHPESNVKYNVTLVANTEYSCVIFKAEPRLSIILYPTPPEDTKIGQVDDPLSPRIYLRRWCAGPPHMCFGLQFIDIDFYVEIYFTGVIHFKVTAYGRERRAIAPEVAMAKSKDQYEFPILPEYKLVKEKLKNISMTTKGNYSNVYKYQFFLWYWLTT